MATSTTSVPGQSTRRWRRPRTFLWLLVIVPLVLAIGVSLYLRVGGGLRLEEALAQADRTDPTWRIDDLEAERRPFPEAGKNGIDQVLKIQAAMPKSVWPNWTFPGVPDDPALVRALRTQMEESFEVDQPTLTLLNDQQARNLRSELKRVEPAVDLARHMTDFPYGRAVLKWRRDYVSTPLGHIQTARMVAWLMKYDGLLQAHDNKIVAALQNAKAALYSSRAIGDEPTPASQLLRQICDKIAVGLIQQSLACGVASENCLIDLQQELVQESQTPFYLQGTRGERACFDKMLQLVQNAELSFKEFRQIVIDCAGPGMLGTPGRAQDWKLELAIVSSYLNVRNERASCLAYLTTIQELCGLPTWERLDRISAGGELANKESGLMISLLAPLNKRCCEEELRAIAMLRTAYVGLALERYRLAHGRWPAGLKELVPQYLPEIPLDPFDGASLRLRRTETGIVIYSVSLDRIDQQGHQLAKPLASGSDISFELLDPEQRRRPGKPFPPPPIPPPGSQPPR